MKRVLPGPYTFILEATSSVPKLLNANKKDGRNTGARQPYSAFDRKGVREPDRHYFHP